MVKLRSRNQVVLQDDCNISWEENKYAVLTPLNESRKKFIKWLNGKDVSDQEFERIDLNADN